METNNYNYKIWLCGMTQNSFKDIDELTKDVYSYFDGLIFVDHKSDDGTRELLEFRKGSGEVISIPWMRNHGWSMQAIFNSQKLLPGDWFVIRDSKERLNPYFCKTIRSIIDQLIRNQVRTVYSYSKIFMGEYYPDIVWTQVSPHCCCQNLKPNYIELSQIEQFKDPKVYAWNDRGNSRPNDSFIDHFVKYIFEYKISNHMLVGRENNIEDFYKHEKLRQNFLLYCRNTLHIDNTVESLKQYILNNPLSDQIKVYFNINRYLNDFYCYHVLKQSLDEIVARHKTEQLFFIK
jgi:hypothetical protein